MSLLRNRRSQTLLDSKLLIMGTHIEIKHKEENLLGKGGFGVGWRGVDKRNNETIVVKQVHRISEMEVFVERDLRLIQECRHQNVLRFYKHIIDNSSVYFILELCVGNLDEFVKDKDINLPICLEYMTNMCLRLKCLHGKGIARKDNHVKSEKVLVKDNVVKESNLGLAKECIDSISGQSRRRTGGVGTLNWMAPKLCTTVSRPEYGISVDVFSSALLFLSLLAYESGEHLTAHTGMF